MFLGLYCHLRGCGTTYYCMCVCASVWCISSFLCSPRTSALKWIIYTWYIYLLRIGFLSTSSTRSTWISVCLLCGLAYACACVYVCRIDGIFVTRLECVIVGWWILPRIRNDDRRWTSVVIEYAWVYVACMLSASSIFRIINQSVWCIMYVWVCGSFGACSCLVAKCGDFLLGFSFCLFFNTGVHAHRWNTFRIGCIQVDRVLFIEVVFIK